MGVHPSTGLGFCVFQSLPNSQALPGPIKREEKGGKRRERGGKGGGKRERGGKGGGKRRERGGKGGGKRGERRRGKYEENMKIMFDWKSFFVSLENKRSDFFQLSPIKSNNTQPKQHPFLSPSQAPHSFPTKHTHTPPPPPTKNKPGGSPGGKHFRR